ncbi:rho GTPase-activating protein 15-like isoform X2 [Glandiceps talaboti]
MADDSSGKGARLQALFPYSYKAADGLVVAFQKGDEFTLVKKAGQDWWFVKKDGDKKSVYVPAKYMKEISPPSQQSMNGGGSGLSASVENLYSEVPDERVPIPVPDYEETENSVSSQGYSDISSSSELLNITSSPQASFDNNSVSNTSSPGIEPPQPTRPPSQVLGNNWEVHYDDKGRKFFYNAVSKESSWKPPRGRKVTSPPQNVLPHGWREETDDHGDQVYINEVTNDKWHSSQDSSGKVYYYSENGIDTAWELPETDPMPRSQTDTNISLEEGWRMRNQIKTSTELRDSRTQSMIANISPSTARKSATLPGNLSISGIPSDNSGGGIQRSLSDLAVHDRDNIPTEKQGLVNKAKIFENGKKIKKNWCTSYLVLSPPHLLFYKDQKSANLKSGSPEMNIHLKGALVEWTKEKSSKKFVFQLSTLGGVEILIQCDNAMVSQQWYECLNIVVSRLSPVPNRRLTTSVDISDEDDDNDVGIPGRSDSGKYDRQARTGGKLKRLLSRRPKKETLEKKGIIQDRVFGSHLVQLCEKERSSVPKFVIMCIACIDKRGLQVDGIYRVSGNMSQIQKLRVIVDQEQPLNLNDPKWDDIHVIAGCLKLFFRELKEPLFPFKFFDKFVYAIKMRDRKGRLKAFKGLISVLPRPNYETMRILFYHLQRVIQHESYNRMNAQSIAIVFGPTLLWPEIETGNIAINMVYQNQIVEFILLELNHIFPE